MITPLLWWLFVPIYHRLRVTSVYEYLEVRFGRAMRRLGTLLFALYAIGWMGSMVYATGLILKAVLGLDPSQLGAGLFHARSYSATSRNTHELMREPATSCNRQATRGQA
ncbi:MAG: hypothetical protein ACYTG0_32550 [Planctomycetota bacterium]